MKTAEKNTNTPPKTVPVPAGETVAAEQTEKPADNAAASQKQTKKTEPVKEVQQLAAKCKEQSDFITPYAKAYPKEKAFYVTSDKQVFFEKDRNLAVMHQNSLASEEKVQTIKVK